MGSPLGVNLDLQHVVAGGEAFLEGKTQRISGDHREGQHDLVPLVKPNATFVSILSMQWFTAVKPDTPYSTSGLTSYPAAGPYYIASRDPGRSTVLKRNPYYKGDRPANPDQIVFTPNVDQNQSLLQVKSGQSDIDINYTPPTANADLAKQFGVNKGRFFVGSTSCVNYMAMNNARAPFDNLTSAGRSTTRSTGRRRSVCSARTAASAPRRSSCRDPRVQAVQRVPAQGCRHRQGETDRRRGNRVGADGQRHPHDVPDIDEQGTSRGVQPQAGWLQDQ